MVCSRTQVLSKQGLMLFVSAYVRGRSYIAAQALLGQDVPADYDGSKSTWPELTEFCFDQDLATHATR